ncbi:MAG TPA: DUF5691 domain-containing protein [Ktedonobacterales bacterium]|nr:DUF5691 domain-containing protein [Ktedonobacterales bacterium]
MDTLTAAALAGTSQRPSADLASGTDVDALAERLAERLPNGEAERTLLLQAGALAVYRLAGRLPEALPADPPAPAPAETLPVCSPGAAELLRQLLSGRNADLLPEALERMRAAGLRLPPDLLSLALRSREREPRQALVHVLGARGRWLAAQNTAWSWVAQTLVESAETLPDDAETIWQEGTTAERLGVLRQLRAVDPARGREWLAAVWKQEKADTRAALIETFAAGLGSDDEAFLEAALDDRAAAVRDTARSLLARIPTSAFTARMRARADAALVYKNGALDAKPPTALEKDAIRDGITEKPPRGTGEREWWLAQIIRAVPPSHWVRRFGAGPDTLIAATAASKWRSTILANWTQAAVSFDDTPWIAPLWSFWLQPAPKKEDVDRDGLRALLAPRLPPAEREAWALAALADPGGKHQPDLDATLAVLPRPWSIPVARTYLAGLRACVAALTAKSPNVSPWDDTLDTAALALPPQCFDAALEPFDIPADNRHWYIQQFSRQLDAFADAIRIRRRIHEEIRV